MSQELPQRPRPEQQHHQEPIKYGDVLPVEGDLADKPIAPGDAALMQSAESMVLGQTQKGGPAAVMQSAATRNERAGLVKHDDITDAARDQGVSVAETDVPGVRIIRETVAGQVVGAYVQPAPVPHTTPAVLQKNALTIGEALEATARTSGDKPVDQSDASAIQAAEVRATGSNVLAPGGLSSQAQSAASYNAAVDRDEDKIKLRDVLTDATTQLPADKAATRQDAEGVMSAELRNNPNLEVYPGGVAASVAAAARINASDQNNR